MAITQAPPPNMLSKGAVSANFVRLFGSVWLFGAAVAPTNGTSGDGASWADKGSMYIDSNAGELYLNTNTKASPTWTKQT